MKGAQAVIPIAEDQSETDLSGRIHSCRTYAHHAPDRPAPRPHSRSYPSVPHQVDRRPWRDLRLGDERDPGGCRERATPPAEPAPPPDCRPRDRHKSTTTIQCPTRGAFGNGPSYYSQFYEDYILGYVFKDQKSGFYVDVGANDPDRAVSPSTSTWPAGAASTSSRFQNWSRS